MFCTSCGTRLFSWRTNGTAAGVALAAFDDRNAFAPTEHIWVSEKIDWVSRRRPDAISGTVPAMRTGSRKIRASVLRSANRGAVNFSLYDLSVWVIPLLIAITFHEAAHAFVAWRLGDNTA